MKKISSKRKEKKGWLKKNYFSFVFYGLVLCILHAIFFGNKNQYVDLIVTIAAIICLIVMIFRLTATKKHFIILIIGMFIVGIIGYFVFQFPILLGAFVFGIAIIGCKYIKPILSIFLVVFIVFLFGFWFVSTMEAKAGTSGEIYSTGYFLNHLVAMDISTSLAGFITVTLIGLLFGYLFLAMISGVKTKS